MPMTVPSSARTLTGRMPATSFLMAARSLPNNCNSIEKTGSFTGRIARACGSCVRIWMAPKSKRLSTPARAMRVPAKTRRNGALASRSTLKAEKSTGPRKGQTPANRQDIEVLYNNLPEPIDLDLDLGNRIMYWTDRGDPPRGNTVNRAPMDATNGNRPVPEIVFNHLMEGIGLALDLDNGRMFVTDLAGSVYSANLDGSNKKPVIFAQGNLTGIAYAELPAGS